MDNDMHVFVGCYHWIFTDFSYIVSTSELFRLALVDDVVSRNHSKYEKAPNTTVLVLSSRAVELQSGVETPA